MGKQWKQCQTLFFWAPKSLQMVTAARKLKDAYSLEGKLWSTYAMLSHFSRVRLCATPYTAAHQAPPSWDSPGKNTEVACHFLLQCMKVKSESEVAQSCPTPSDPMDCSPKSRDFALPTKVCLVKVMVFPVVIYGLWRKLSAEELMLLNCGVGEDSCESLGLQGDPTSPS